MANTCQYYIKKTNDPRICGKKSYIIFGEDDDEADTGFLSLLFPVGFECSGPSLWLCRKHYKMLENQTKKLKARTSGISEKVIASSLLHFHLKEFQQKTSVDDDPEVRFIEEKTEDEILASKFEEAKTDGRYIDLTAPDPVEHHIDCPICLEKISARNSTFLNCAHPVCNECLANMDRRSFVANECPVCRNPIDT